MPRILFEKTGNAVYISHLDLMRLFQRAFQRAGLPLTHSKGFNPRPEVSIALPLSVGVESLCEILDFKLETDIPEDIVDKLNAALIPGVTVKEVIPDGRKIRDLRYLDCEICLEYDNGIPEGLEEAFMQFFARKEIPVEKKGKNGMVMQDIAPMMSVLSMVWLNEKEIRLNTRIACQNPTLNPTQIVAAIEKYLPQYKPDFYTCKRLEIYDENQVIFR